MRQALSAGLVMGLAAVLSCEAEASSLRGAPQRIGIEAADAALDRIAARAIDPLRARADVIRALEALPLCFPEHMTPEGWEHVIDEWDMLPPSLAGGEAGADPRFFVDSQVWVGDVTIGLSGRAQPARLTYSFPPDGATWGISIVAPTGPNVLNASLTNGFGDLDLGREYVRQGLAAWRYFTGLTYDEVADDGAAMSQTTARTEARGDIRIGGYGFGTNTFLAYNAFPTAIFAGVGGGDMVINTSYFIPNNFLNDSLSFRYFRNVCAHEHGHGTGAIHTVPCNGSKLMEPAIQTGTNALGVDDLRGGHRSYGDRFAGNSNALDPVDFGNLTSPALRSVIEKDLSTNGANGFDNTDEDWFRFTLSSAQTVTIRVDPRGGTYDNGQQQFQCFGDDVAVNATAAGNLRLELRDAAGGNVVAVSSAGGAGAAEQIVQTPLAAGTYTVLVRDEGPNSSVNQVVQLYDLTIRVGASKAPPRAVAGINKRIGAGVNCWFMGDIYSAVNDTGVSLNSASFDWDLDGDGVFETNNIGKPSRQYISNGVYDVTLRVTDTGGAVGTDTIRVTVFGATTALNDVQPDSGDQGELVPITLTGVNLKNVNGSHVTVSGGNVFVIGVAQPNADGTVVTGLTLQVNANAEPGLRSITVSNSDGMATLAGAFEVMKAFPPCPADLDGDRFVGFSDLNIVVSNFNMFGTGAPGDVNGDGDVDFEDLNIVVSLFNTDCPE